MLQQNTIKIMLTCYNMIILAGYEREINAVARYYWQVMEGRVMPGIQFGVGHWT